MIFYKDETSNVIHGDCRDFPDEFKDALVVTDPPFNIGYHYDEHDDRMPPEEYDLMLKKVCRAPVVMIHYAEDIFAFAQSIQTIPQKVVAWVYPSNTGRQWRAVAWFGIKPDFKRGGGQAYRNQTDKRIQKMMADGREAKLYDWWEINQVKNVSEDKTEHPCQMPLDVMTNILKITECKVVVDPFCGSGTTLVAAKMLGIKCVGFDKSLKYCGISAGRLSQIII